MTLPRRLCHSRAGGNPSSMIFHYYGHGSPEIIENSIFDVASVTKSIPTFSLAVLLINPGKLYLDDQMIKYIPEFANSDRENVTISHLLSQTLSYSFALAEQKDKSPDKILNHIFTAEFKEPPGSSYAYSNATSILLGIVVERIMGDTLDNLGRKYFFEPLGMARTTFWPLEHFTKEEIVPTEIDPWRGREIRGEVHDESAWKLQQKMVVGSAGLFSTVPDLLNFLEMLLGPVPPFVKGRGGILPHNYGWELNQPWMGNLRSPQTYGKTAFTGCSVTVDPEKGFGIVLLSNTTYPHRRPLEEHQRVINLLRQQLADVVWTNSFAVG